jgi:hypothetical protein
MLSVTCLSSEYSSVGAYGNDPPVKQYFFRTHSMKQKHIRSVTWIEFFRAKTPPAVLALYRPKKPHVFSETPLYRPKKSHVFLLTPL